MRALVLASLLLVACQSSAAIGTSCARTSECGGALVCAYGRCRSECRLGRDCSAGERCLVDASGAGRCTLDTESHCAAGTDCGAGLRCTSGECRVRCVSARDCGPEAECAVDGTCAALACPESPCRVTPPSCGCPDGTACYLLPAGNGCRPPGSFMELERCTHATECSIGLACASTPSDAMMRCRIPCATDADCEGGRCTGAGDAAVCAGRACDPTQANACPAGLSCTWSDTQADGGRVLDCFESGALASGASCTSRSECAPGLACIGAMGAAICAPLCVHGSDCASGSCASLRDARGAVMSAPGVCANPCDPIAGTGCAAGMACRATIAVSADADHPGLVVSPTCTAIGTATEGSACTSDTECALGLTCDPTGGGCLRACLDPRAPDPDCGGRGCIPFLTGAPTLGTHVVGLCQSPIGF